MTDNEIIKVWAKCLTDNEDCSKCPLLGIGCHEQILDILNRQKADLENYKQIAENQQSVSMDKEVEIKRLKAEVERLRNSGIRAKSVDDWLKYCNGLRAEAVKEFAERVKKEFHTEYTWLEIEREYFEERIDNLLKEMEGDDSAN